MFNFQQVFGSLLDLRNKVFDPLEQLELSYRVNQSTLILLRQQTASATAHVQRLERSVLEIAGIKGRTSSDAAHIQNLLASARIDLRVARLQLEKWERFLDRFAVLRQLLRTQAEYDTRRWCVRRWKLLKETQCQLRGVEKFDDLDVSHRIAVIDQVITEFPSTKSQMSEVARVAKLAKVSKAAPSPRGAKDAKAADAAKIAKGARWANLARASDGARAADADTVAKAGSPIPGLQIGKKDENSIHRG